MLNGEVKPPRQLHFGLKSRREIRPRHSGYLVSNYEQADDLGKLVKGGAKLGEVVDIYSYQVLEELTAPFDGYLFFSRYSGVVGARHAGLRDRRSSHLGVAGLRGRSFEE